VESGVILIPLLIIVSGGVAYVGNLVGRATGRRRLTVFGLRPRHTAQLITILTGMIITIITVFATLLASGDARTGLFRLNELREQITTAEERLKELKGGDIAYLRNQEVLREVIDGRLAQEEILRRLDGLRLRAVDLAVINGISPDLVTGAVLILDPPNVTWEAIARIIAGRSAETVVRIVSAENTLRGEALRVYVQRIDRRLVYARGTVVASGMVDGQAGRERVGRELLSLVDIAAVAAQGRLLSPPFARTSDPPQAQVDVDDHRRAVAEVVARHREVRVRLVARRDITTDSALSVSFLVPP
jgi:uncharacterized protein (DUF3084 family)